MKDLSRVLALACGLRPLPSKDRLALPNSARRGVQLRSEWSANTNEVKGDRHTELHPNGTRMESKIRWIDNCTYETTLEKLVYASDDFMFKLGDHLNVHIDRIEGNQIFISMDFKGPTFKGDLTKEK
jgi:hypothetical protein